MKAGGSIVLDYLIVHSSQPGCSWGWTRLWNKKNHDSIAVQISYGGIFSRLYGGCRIGR